MTKTKLKEQHKRRKRLYRTARGTSDILPEEQGYWRLVERAITETAGLYGYRRIDTPVFEETGLFRRSAGEYTDVVQKEMYTFEDKGGNSLTLKPEGTPPVCRAYIQHGMHSLPQPVKLYYVSPIFRYDRPQAGRYRQHHQFGCEAIGEADPALDAELIDTAWNFYRSLGLTQISLQLNSIGCRKCRPGYIEALKEHYAAYGGGLCADCLVRLENNPMRLLDCKQASCQGAADSAPMSADYLCNDCQEHFISLQKYLGLLEIPFQLNHRMVRGFDYYTRTVFEIVPPGGGSQSSLGGGGRYDDLIEELGGRPTPAIGFATGIERIILNLKEQEIDFTAAHGVKVLITYLGEEAKDISVKLAAQLRRAGISAVTSTGGKSLKAQMRQANNLGARYAVIIGEEEVSNGTVVLRDMTGAQQQTVAAGDLPATLKVTE
jgi:histidyl-tRNA synthetase